MVSDSHIIRTVETDEMSSLEKMFFFPMLFLFFVFSSSLVTVVYCHADADSCEPVQNCSGDDGPEIRFPFRLKDHQPQRCGYPGFDLFCNDEQTMIHFPPLRRDVVVRQIDYESQRLILAIDGHNNCFSRLLFGTSYSYIPHIVDPYFFSSSYLYPYDDLTLINCSRNAIFDQYVYPIAIASLSDAQHNAFIISSRTDVGSLPVSCQPIKTISVPRLYPLYLNFTRELRLGNVQLEWLRLQNANSLLFEDGVLSLVWYVPGCIDCERIGKVCGYKNSSSTDTVCLSRPPHQRGLPRKLKIIVSSLGSFLLLIFIMLIITRVYYWKSNRKLDMENQIKVENFLNNYKYLKPTRYSYADLKRITGQFRENLGQGGFGSVFKGTLSNGTCVAVKILKNADGEGQDFMNEVGTMGKIHHVNVVRLLGFCADRLKRALIYEYMPNESLEKYIFSKNKNEHFFGWEKLQQIATGIARGIEYLHQGCDQRILHFDIKPHNILLDQNFNPKISDFGLAKLCSKGQSAVSMTNTRGTIGYIAPEVFSRNFGNISYKSDVYSYGMLLLKMVSGRKSNDAAEENNSQVSFPEWIYDRLHQEEDIGLKFDTAEDAKIAKQLAIVALWCVQWYPVDRPSMKSVVQMLEGSMESLTMPPNPLASSAPVNSCLTNLSTIPE